MGTLVDQKRDRNGSGTEGGADAGGEPNRGDAGGDAEIGVDATVEAGPADDGGQTEHPYDPDCRGRLLPAEARRLDIYVMMDASLMIELPVVKRSAKPGLDAFVDAPDSSGVAVGIRDRKPDPVTAGGERSR